MTKECSVCHVPKEAEKDFFKKETSADGYEAMCKDCKGEYNRERMKKKKAARDIYSIF